MNIATIPLNVYTSFITRLTPPLCNYKYTCSQYCFDSIKKNGLINGVILTRRRLKSCSDDGIRLRSEFNINTKHFCSGSIVTRGFEPITKSEKFELIILVLNLIIAACALTLSVYYFTQPLALAFAISYFLILIYKLYCESNHRIIKLNWILMIIALLPMLLISFPSMLITVLVNSIFNSSDLNKNLINKTKIASTLQVLAFGSIFINTTLACVILVAALLMITTLEFSSKDRVMDNYSLLWSMLTAIACYFNPIYSLVFVALWWQTKINRV
jgi:Putative membrane protein insertion efficiency factor